MFQRLPSDESGVNFFNDESGTIYRVTRDGISNNCLWSVYVKGCEHDPGWDCHVSVAAIRVEVALAKAKTSYYRSFYYVDG